MVEPVVIADQESLRRHRTTYLDTFCHALFTSNKLNPLSSWIFMKSRLFSFSQISREEGKRRRSRKSSRGTE